MQLAVIVQQSICQTGEKRGLSMYPNENEEKRADPFAADDIVSNVPYSELSQNEMFYGAPTHNMPVYNPHPYSAPVRTEPVYGVQSYHETVYNEPVTLENSYCESYDDPNNLYSPGICVNRPYPRTRESGNGNGRNGNGHSGNGYGRNGNVQENSKGLVGFLRAMALVLACTFFSGSAAYLVLDHRVSRGDFSPPAQVVLGNSAIIERQPDDAATIAIRDDSMTAQSIYDMARNQVVAINTDAPSFFGLPDISGDSAPISGSGFIISSDGYILTNFHVIEIAHKHDLPIRVVLNDGVTHEAVVIGFEQHNDVAVIKIKAEGLSPVFIGNSDNTRVGQTIYAIGNPFGDLVYTMTDGIVSALDRVVSVEGKSIRTFQFSAAVNSGNSGGPIYNIYGEVIGIVTAKIVRGNVEGIGFAIPINDAIEIATELIEHGYISGRPLMGITGQDVSPANAEYFNWVVGVYIRAVTQGSAADKAGIEIGDIITALDGDEVNSMETLRLALRDHRAGDTTTITIWRDGEIHDLTITFDEDMYAGQQRPITRPDSPDPFESRP